MELARLDTADFVVIDEDRHALDRANPLFTFANDLGKIKRVGSKYGVLE